MSYLKLKGEVIELPSLGTLYDDTLGLIDKSSLRVRPFLATDQKILSGSRGNAHKIYSEILDRTIVEPEKIPDLNCLLMEDVLAVLFSVRILSFGPLYKLRFGCLDCGEKNDTEINLGELETYYCGEDIEELKPTLEISLPDSSDTLVLHRHTLRDEKTIQMLFNSSRKRGVRLGDQDVARNFFKFASLINEINGEKPKTPHSAVQYLENLTLNDMDELTHLYSERDKLGISSSVELECSFCGGVSEVELAINSEFFRPKRRSRKDS